MLLSALPPPSPPAAIAAPEVVVVKIGLPFLEERRFYVVMPPAPAPGSPTTSPPAAKPADSHG